MQPPRRPTSSDPTRRVVVRFLTESDFPPFNFYDEDGVLVGLNVDVARAICLELNTACDIKVRPWGELLLALKRGEADAVIASHAVTPQNLAEVDFTDRYFHMPGRFAGKIGGEAVEMTPEGLDGKRIGVAKNTAHEAFLKSFFRSSVIRSYESTELARDALLQGRGRFRVRRRREPRVLAARHGVEALLRAEGGPVPRAASSSATASPSRFPRTTSRSRR